MKLIPAVLLPALLACALASNSSAQSGVSCPNVRATNMPVRVTHEGDSTRCGLGLMVLGIPISIGGGRCYKNEFIYPAHQECLGSVNEGTFCAHAPDMPVQWNKCECQTAAVLGTGISLPKCSCNSAGTAGTVEDAETMSCRGAD